MFFLMWLEGTPSFLQRAIFLAYIMKGKCFRKTWVFFWECALCFFFILFFIIFSNQAFILFYFISHDNWWVSWENQIKTKEILQGPLLNNKALSRRLKPQCNKNWVRLRVSLLPMQWGSTRRKKHKSFFYKFKNKILKNPKENPKKRTPKISWMNGLMGPIRRGKKNGRKTIKRI